MSDNQSKSIGAVWEKTTKNGDKFFAGEINLDEINHALVYRRQDNKGNTKEKISITLFENTSKSGKKYRKVTMRPEYKPGNKQNNDDIPDGF